MADEFKVTHKIITVAGRKLTVWKSTFDSQLKRFTFIEQAEKRVNGNGASQEDEGIEAIVRRGFTRLTYPSLVACTTGNVFTEEQCFKFEGEDLELWITTARDLNPTWFPVTTVTPEEEVLEKKSS